MAVRSAHACMDPLSAFLLSCLQTIALFNVGVIYSPEGRSLWRLASYFSARPTKVIQTISTVWKENFQIQYFTFIQMGLWCSQRHEAIIHRTTKWMRSSESRGAPVGGKQPSRAGGSQLSRWYRWLNGVQQLVPILKHLITLEWWRWHVPSPHSNLI